MGTIFAKKQRPQQDKVSEEDRAILTLKMQKNKMQQMHKRHEASISKQKEMARTLLREDRKDRALILLKRKRYEETLVDRILGQLDQVERMIHEIESAQLNKEVFERLKQGNEALQAFSIEDAERIMEESREAAAYQEEISNIVATHLSAADLEEVEKEFDEMIRKQLPDVPVASSEPNIKLPEAPTHEMSNKREKVKEKRTLVAA